MLFGDHFSPFAVFGKILIQSIKAVALPLVFVSIVEAVLVTSISWRDGCSLLRIVLINATCALAIALTLANAFEPGKSLDFRAQSAALNLATSEPFKAQSLNPLNIIIGHIPETFVQPFIDNNIIGVVLIALLLGIAARQILTASDTSNQINSQSMESLARILIRIFEKILSWLIRLTPVAIFGVCAKTVGEHGLTPFQGLLYYVLIALTGLLIQILVVYQCWIYFRGRSLSHFWRSTKDTLVYAFGTNSSLATLPLTLKTLDSLGVKKSCSRLGACIGTNLNNDGIILYEAVAVLFVSQAYGIDLSITQQISAVLLCLVAAIGVAGVPEAGIISLSLVLTTVSLPLEILPLLLTVDWLVARARSVTNVLADMTVSIALDVGGNEQARGVPPSRE